MAPPIIASAVRTVSRHTHYAAARHCKALRKTIAYRKTKDLIVMYKPKGGLKLLIFADADYADSCNVRRTVLSVVFMLGITAVSASSTMQHCTTPSRSKTKYVGIALGARTALAIKIVVGFCSSTTHWQCH